LYRLTGWAIDEGIDLDGLEVIRPSLEDIYLQLTEPAGTTGPDEPPAKRRGRRAA
jgi:hypothetical protein